MAARPIQTKDQLRLTVERTVQFIPASDVCTYVYPEAFGGLSHWGIDTLLTDSALIDELQRCRPDWSDARSGKFTVREQADAVWTALFRDRIPYSEACRSVLSVLQRLGLDTRSRDLQAYRSFFSGIQASDYTDLIFKLSGVTTVCMTNDPFSDAERQAWEQVDQLDPRFNTSLRIDKLLNAWDTASARLRAWGYDVDAALNGKTYREIRGFLKYWIARMNPLYLSAALPADLADREMTARAQLIEQCVLPVAGEANIPLALLIESGHPSSSALGQAVRRPGQSALSVVEALCAAHPEHKFMCSLGPDGEQGRLTLLGRQYRNLHLIGSCCEAGVPGSIEETVSRRLELLGADVTPWYSGGRSLEWLLYKWDQSRAMAGKVLYDKYSGLMDTGWRLTEDEIGKDVAGLFGESFWTFLGRPNPATAFKA